MQTAVVSLYLPNHQVCSKPTWKGTVKRRRREGGQWKRWEDNFRERTGLQLSKSQRAMESRGTMDNTGYKVICWAQMTLLVKG